MTGPVSTAPAADDRDAALHAALAEVRGRYVERRPLSKAAHEAASHHLPGGNTRTVLHFDPFPFRVRRGWGATLEDVDGHRYVDLLGEYTAGLFGHSNPAIKAARSSPRSTTGSRSAPTTPTRRASPS